VRLIIAKRPLSEKQIVTNIFRLGIFSGVLAIITAFLVGVEV
jgi:UDP-N-acetylglucosamine--dolichyl-phosphate N-acetylglucosaminephosphotransferase